MCLLHHLANSKPSVLDIILIGIRRRDRLPLADQNRSDSVTFLFKSLPFFYKLLLKPWAPNIPDASSHTHAHMHARTLYHISQAMFFGCQLNHICRLLLTPPSLWSLPNYSRWNYLLNSPVFLKVFLIPCCFSATWLLAKHLRNPICISVSLLVKWKNT